MTRVVVDTNVLVSSFFGGNPALVVDLWRKGKVVLCLTNAIVEEYILVLARLQLQTDSELEELVRTFRASEQTLFTFKTPSVNVCPDEADNKFIEAAVALDAKYIVSGDKHLLSLKEYIGIQIIKPKELIDMLS